jgi:peptide/nickel transport system substrate-binding protein
MRRRALMQSMLTGVGALAAPSISRGSAANTLRYVPQTDLALIDPVQSIALVTRNHGAMVFDTLYGMDENFVVRPQMAAGHVVEADGKIWNITLRAALKWHDGTPVLARDVVASLKRWWQIDAFGQTLRAATDDVSAVSDTTLRFRLKKSFPLLPAVFAKPSAFCAIMPERLANTPPNVAVHELIGSGPFRYVANERVAWSLAVYEKFADYVPREGRPSFMAGPKIAYLERVEWHTIPDGNTASGALQSGEVDWLEAPPPDLLPVLRGMSSIKVEIKDRSGSLGMIRPNALHPPFDNPAIRRALLGGISQTDFMTAVMGTDHSLWRDNVGFFLPGSNVASDAGMSALTSPRNLEKVKADLQAAGYKGEKVVLLVPTEFTSLNAMCEVVGDMFRRVGIDLDYRASDSATLGARLRSKEPVEKGGWSAYANYVPGISTISPATHAWLRGIGADAPFGWPTSVRLEQLRDGFLDAVTPEEQARIGQQMQAQAFVDVPYLPTGMWYQPTAFRSTVSGILNGFPIFWNVRKG